jgi:pentatricopeptide repeat domain-containing protein 1
MPSTHKLWTFYWAFAQGTKAEVRTYNTIINACNRSGQPEHALKVYERMIADGTQPTATTYTALISAYGKTGKVTTAAHFYDSSG